MWEHVVLLLNTSNVHKQVSVEVLKKTNVIIILQKQTDDIRALYCCYLKREIENRDQQMAYRALKMKKLEKEISLLDKQLM